MPEAPAGTDSRLGPPTGPDPFRPHYHQAPQSLQTAKPGRAAIIEDMDADAVITTLDLIAHPEGGYYRETWADRAGSAIYFLLRDGQTSAWHRVHQHVEIWHFYAGAPLDLSIREQGRSQAARTIRLGSDLGSAEQPQAVVPAGAWQSARTLGPWSLVGCTVAPPFDFAAFELAPGNRLPH